MINKIKKIYSNPTEYKLALLNNFAFLFPDKLFLKLKFKLRMGYKLRLRNPITYSEKIQWLKLYGRTKKDTQLADKYAVKQIVTDLIGAEYVVPLIAVWDSVDDIDFSILPSQFVLKVTHDSGGVFICKDKSKIDCDKVRNMFRKSLPRDFYLVSREKAYKDIQHRIIAEQYIEDEYGELRDYKFYCFNGKPMALFIATGRSSGAENITFDFFDMEFNHLPFTNGHPNSTKPISKPKCFEEMKQIAAKLSQGIPHVRVDLYEVNGHVFFGEYTFSSWGGMEPFDPVEWDYKFGEWLEININK